METDPSVSTLIKHLNECMKELQRKKVDPHIRGELFVLKCIEMHSGSVIPSEISNLTDMSTARVAAVLGNLEKKELITREPDRTDRRKTLVALTDKGRALCARQFEHLAADVERLLRELGEPDATDFLRIIGRIPAILKNF
jgi:DNA-binding MarR family transcriptional regulator